MDYGPARDNGPVFGEVMRANCQAHKAAGQDGMQPGHLLRAYGSKAGMEHQASVPSSLEAQMQKRKAVKLLRRVMHILAQAKQDAVPLGAKRSAADSLQPEHALKRPLLIRSHSTPIPGVTAVEQPQQMEWMPQPSVPDQQSMSSMQHSLAAPVSVWRPSTGGAPSAICPSYDASPPPNPFTVTTPPLPPPRQLPQPAAAAAQQQLLQAMRMDLPQQQQQWPTQPPVMALHRANSVPPAAELSWQEGAADSTGAMFKARSLPLPESAASRMRVNRRNIVKRLAELGTPAAQPAMYVAGVAPQGAGAALQQQQQQPPPVSPLLKRGECGAYARRIGRFLGCGEGLEECAGDRPSNLVAKAALRRYLDGQVAVGASKDEVWSDLNGEVGDVLLKRLATRSAALASRRQSPLSQGALKAN